MTILLLRFRSGLCLVLVLLCGMAAGAALGQSQSFNNRPPSQDTYVSEASAQTNFGGSGVATLGSQGGAKGILLQYNLTPIPQNAVIVSATLSFSKASTTHSGNMVVQLRRRRASWSESTVTWNSSLPLQDPIVGSATINTGLSFPTITDGALKTLVSEWVANPTSNFGLTILPAVATGTDISFYTKENTLGRNPIRLSVTYQACSAPGTFTLISPANGQQFPANTLSTTLSWNASFGATSYDVYFGPGTNPPLLQNVTTTSRGVGVDPGQTYSWRVVAKNSCGTTASSSGTRSFSVASALADLEASSIDVSPPNPTAEDPITITGVIRNQGTATSPAFNWLLALNANLIDSGRPAFLAPDGAITGASISWSGTLPPGEYRVDLAADTGEEVQEVSEDNNTQTVEFAVTPRYGTTVITHGYQIDGDLPCWPFSMAQAIRRRAERGKIKLYDRDSGAFGPCVLPVYCNDPEILAACESDTDGEDILIFDWAIDSNNPLQGYSEAAGAALFAALMDTPNIQLDHLNLIGHSRGAVVNSEAVERLIASGQPPPERVTMLDPVDDFPGFSDLDVNYGKPYQYQGVVAWDAGATNYDTYFQTCECFPLTGHAIPGSVNMDLTASFHDPLCLSPSQPICNQHAWVHAWYQFTIDPEGDPATVPDGSHMTDAWFGTGDRNCTTGTPGSMDKEGFAFSRLGGNLPPCSADGSRTPASFDFNSAREGIVNGDFARGDAMVRVPGWEPNGGGGNGFITGIGDWYLALDATHSSRDHDRVYIPPATGHLDFMLRVVTPDPDDLLKIKLGAEEFTTGLSFKVGFHHVQVPIQFSGRVVPLGFAILSQGTSSTARVDIDNVRFVMTGEPTQPYVLSLTTEGSGSGIITSDDGTVDCGSVCRASFASNEEVALIATPSPGSLFTGWSGDPDCLDGVVTMVGNLSCTAVFTSSVARPAAPTWLRTTATSASSIDLLWDDNSNDEDGFKIERKEGPAGPWTVVATLPADATSFQDATVSCGIPWAYRVWAFNAAGESSRTNEAAATPECQCSEVVNPESLSIGAVGGNGSFAVTACGSWTAISEASWIEITSGASGTGNGAVGFQVARNNAQSPRTGTVSLPELGLVFTVQQAAAPADPGFTSFLRLVNGTVAGQTVDPDHRTVTVAPGAAISGTLNLRIDSSFASNAVMALGITRSWGDHATSYTDLGHFSTPVSGLIRNVSINYTSPATPGTYHVLAAFRGEFNAGQVMSATNWGVGTLVWNNGDDLADWSAERIATANQEGTVLADYLLSGGNVPMWVPATAITIVVESPSVPRPTDPTWLRTTPSSSTSIDLLWDDNSNNEDGFKIERKVGPAGPWTIIATPSANTTAYQDSGLTCGTTYAYRVWAFNAGGDSGKTNEAGMTPVCGPERLFGDDFEDGSTAGWQTWVSGWSESGGAYHGTNTGANLRNEAVWTAGYGWSDYSVEADLALLSTYGPADGQLLLRYNSETDRISCRLFQYQSSRELQLLVPGQPMVSVPFAYVTGQRYRLRASAVGDDVSCEVVGHLETRLSQISLGSSTGTVGLRNTHIPVDFDNLEVWSEP